MNPYFNWRVCVSVKMGVCYGMLIYIPIISIYIFHYEIKMSQCDPLCHIIDPLNQIRSNNHNLLVAIQYYFIKEHSEIVCYLSLIVISWLFMIVNYINYISITSVINVFFKYIIYIYMTHMCNI